MSDLKIILDKVKNYIGNSDYKSATIELEKILLILKNDYEAGINKEKSGMAYNKLLKVRKELKNGTLTDLTYDTLHLAKKEIKKELEPAESKAEDEIDTGSISSKESDVLSEISLDDLSFDVPSLKAPKIEYDDKNYENSEDKVEKSEDIKKVNSDLKSNEISDLKGEKTIEEEVIENAEEVIPQEFKFKWDDIPTVKFEDIAGLDNVKELVEIKVLLPLLHPEATVGYVTNGGGGLCLYGPPGTGKTMMAAAIANKINANFCSITPSDLLRQGIGNTEKALKALFAQARKFKCAVIYFDEMDALTSKTTKSQATKNLRSEFLAQLQGMSSYGEKSGNILFLVCATNKPWEIDSAFLRPGRFGTKIYVGLPDYAAIKYILDHHLEKIRKAGVVEIKDDVDTALYADKLIGYNCSDISNILGGIEEASMRRFLKTNEKYISNEDFVQVIEQSVSSVQKEDLIKLEEWKKQNDSSSIKIND